MATSLRPAPGSLPPDGGPGGRLHIHGIKEMPAGYDAEVAELFRDLRSASGLTEADLAAQLATRPEVVQALEQGALYALPPWPETYRVVATYGTLLNLDVRPLLRRIYAQVDAGVVGLAPKSMPDVPFMAPPENVEREYQGQAPQAGPPAGEAFSPPPQQPSPPAPTAQQQSPSPAPTAQQQSPAPAGQQQLPSGFDQRVIDVPPPTETRFIKDEVVLQIAGNITVQRLQAAVARLGLTLLASEKLDITGSTVARRWTRHPRCTQCSGRHG